MKLTPPGNAVLLHACCAPCSGAIIEALCAQGIRATVFWSNSNICTAGENERRLAVLRPYAARFGFPVVEDTYDHEDWLAFLRSSLPPNSALASYPERGLRCLMCFRYRLLRAARYAVSHGFDCLTTSLASSRWKSLEQVDAAGSWAVATVQTPGQAEGNALPAASLSMPSLSCPAPTGHPVPLAWWSQNWRKGGLQPRRDEIIREQNFYNQTFCGCEFSLAAEHARQTVGVEHARPATTAGSKSETEHTPCKTLIKNQ